MIATLRPDGQPVTAATWYLWEDGRVSTHYTGQPHARRERGRVSAWIEADRWYGWGSLKENNQA